MRERMTRAERHRHILRTAKVLFQERGYDNVTIADVIEASNVARGTFYLHFKSLDQLLTDLFEQVVEETWQKIAALIADESIPFRECTLLVMKSAFAIFADDDNLGVVFGTGGGHEFRRQRQQALYDKLGGLVVQASQARHNEPIVHLDWTVAILISMVGEMSYYAATHPSLKDDAEKQAAFFNHIVDFSIGGLEHQLLPYINGKDDWRE